MPNCIEISVTDIVHSIKLSYQIPDVVEKIASQNIIVQAAQEVGIQVEEAELQIEGDKLRLEKKLITAKDTWTWLEKHHLSINNFEELVYNKVLERKLANHLFSPYVEKFFYERRVDYDAAITYEVIFDNRDLALELFCALEEGEITFPEIARQFIQEPELRRAGGYQGLRRRKDLRPDIAAAVFSASPPQIIKPITTSKGVYLVWVEEIIQPQLDEQLREQIITESFSEWLKQQIQAVNIVITPFDISANNSVPEELLKQA